MTQAYLNARPLIDSAFRQPDQAQAFLNNAAASLFGNDLAFFSSGAAAAPGALGDPGSGGDTRRKVKHPAWKEMERRLEAELRELLEGETTAPAEQLQEIYQEGADQVQRDLDQLELALAQLRRAQEADNVEIMNLQQELDDIESLRALALEIQARRMSILAAIAAAIFYYY